MTTLKPNRSGSRRSTALLLALALALAAVPCSAAPTAQDQGLVEQIARNLLSPLSLWDLLSSFFGGSEDLQATYGESANYLDPDGQPLSLTDSMPTSPSLLTAQATER